MLKFKIGILIAFLFIAIFFASCESLKKSESDQPLVYLNHVYVSVDSSTYSDICNSEFIKNIFAYINTKTVKADGNESWTGTYIWGQNTYIEFFNLGSMINRGYSGIGFGTEMYGGIDSLYRAITDSGKGNVEKSMRHFRTETGEIPWFYLLYSTEFDSATILSTWVMEYIPEYVRYKFPDIDSTDINISRKLYNHKSYQKNLLLKDITEVELALDKFDYNKFHQDLQSYAYKMERMGDKIIGYGPGIKFIIVYTTKEKAGICRIKFSLNNHKYNEQTINFGKKSKLILNPDKTAEWYFNI